MYGNRKELRKVNIAQTDTFVIPSSNDLIIQSTGIVTTQIGTRCINCVTHDVIMRINWFTTAFLALFFLSLTGISSADTAFNSCRDFNSSGIYRMTTDIYNNSGKPCLMVNASDVVIDGNNHVLDGNFTGEWPNKTKGIVQWNHRVTNLTIKNFVIKDWGVYGIYFEGAANSSIINNSIIGIGSRHISLYKTNNITIKNNRLYDNSEAEADGINLNKDNYTYIINNTIENLGSGIFGGNRNLRIINNTIVGSLDSGINTGAPQSVIQNNNISFNAQTGDPNAGGIELYASTINITENIINNNGIGIHFINADRNRIINNSIQRNGDCSSSGQSPQICNPKDLVFSPPASTNNTFINNTFTSFIISSTGSKPDKVIVGELDERSQIQLNNLNNVKEINHVNSSVGRNVSTTVAENLSDIFAVQRMKSVVNTSAYNLSYVVFNQSFGNRSLVYIADKEGEDIRYPDQCVNNAMPKNGSVPSVGCYVNTSKTVALFVPHFSGAAFTSDPVCEDNDGDGYGNHCENGPDFDDLDTSRYPGASCSRTCYEGSTFDQDGSCTGGTYVCSTDDSEDDDTGRGEQPPVTNRVTTNVTERMVAISVENATNTSIQLTLPHQSETKLSSLQLGVTTATDFTIQVADAEPTNRRANVSTVSGGAALAYVRINHTIAETTIANASLTFRLPPSRVATPDHVTVYRRTKTWTPLPTTFKGRHNGTLVFQAVSPGLSLFSLAVRRPRLHVRNRTVTTTQQGNGTTVTASIRVQNTGGATGTYTATFTVGNNTYLLSKDIPAHTNRSLTYTRTLTQPGTYTVTVDNTPLTTATIPSSTESATEPDADTTAAPNLPLTIIAGIILLLIIAAVITLRYKE